MLLELYGLPGSGKSFIIKKINRNTFIGFTKNIKIKKIVIKLGKKISIWMPSSIILKNKIYCIIKNISLKPLYIERSINEHINNIIMIAFGYKWRGKRNLYMDEGIIHRIVSFAVNYNIPIEQTFLIINLFEKYLKNSVIIYLDVNVNDCLNGIKKRNRHICEMDELKGEKLKQYLNSFKIYFDAIYHKYSHIKITRENYKELKELLK